MRKYLLLAGISIYCMAGAAYAIDCKTLPDCADLGYTKSSSECDGKLALVCPFDNTKFYCTEESSHPSCADLGYTKSVSDCLGKQRVKCPYDQDKVFCGGDIDLCTKTEIDSLCYSNCLDRGGSHTSCRSKCDYEVQYECLNTNTLPANMFAIKNINNDLIIKDPSLRCMDSDTCYDRYIKSLAAISEKDFAVYIG